MNTDRTHEIIGAYGGNPDRWPESERAVTLAQVAADPALRATLAEARGLDAVLDGWARRDFGGDAAAVAERVLRLPRHGWRLAAGGGLATALALLFGLTGALTTATAPVPTAATTISDEAAFASLFTPTPDEERAI